MSDLHLDHLPAQHTRGERSTGCVAPCRLPPAAQGSVLPHPVVNPSCPIRLDHYTVLHVDCGSGELEPLLLGQGDLYNQRDIEGNAGFDLGVGLLRLPLTDFQFPRDSGVIPWVERRTPNGLLCCRGIEESCWIESG